MKWLFGAVGMAVAAALLFAAVGRFEEGRGYQSTPVPADRCVRVLPLDTPAGLVTCERNRVVLSAGDTTTELFQTPHTVLNVTTVHPPGAESPQLLILTAEEMKAGHWRTSHLYLLAPDDPGHAKPLSPESHYNFWDVSVGDVDGDGCEEVALCTYSCTARDARYARRFFVYSWDEEGDLYPRWRGSRLCRRYVSAQLADVINGGEMLVAYEWNQFGFWGLGHTREYEEVKILQAPAKTADKQKAVLVALGLADGGHKQTLMVVRDDAVEPVRVGVE